MNEFSSIYSKFIMNILVRTRFESLTQKIDELRSKKSKIMNL